MAKKTERQNLHGGVNTAGKSIEDGVLGESVGGGIGSVALNGDAFNQVNSIGDEDPNRDVEEDGPASLYDELYSPPKYTVTKQAGTEELFTVNGIIIRRNSSYQIIGKRDDTAPSALRNRETSKFPTTSIGETKTMPFDRVTNTYDTGFFEGSSCYINKDTAYVKKEVQKRMTGLCEPYEKIVGAGKLHQTNFQFWDNFNIEIYEGKVLFTSDINDLMALYIIAQGKYAVPKEQEGSPEYPNAMYCIVDKNLAVNIQEKRNAERAESIRLFGDMLANNKKRLLYVLNWINFDYTEGSTATRLTSDFYSFVNDAQDINRAETFLDSVRKVETKNGLETYRLYYLLNEMLQRQLVRRTETGYYLESYDLGVDLKAAAARMVTDSSFIEVKFRLLTLANVSPAEQA
jgi:hypothetical protein